MRSLTITRHSIADLHFPPGTTLPGPSNIAATIDARKNYHKNAEQRRRDTAKAWFDGLRSLLPNLTERVPSKLHVLEKSMYCVLSAVQCCVCVVMIDAMTHSL